MHYKENNIKLKNISNLLRDFLARFFSYVKGVRIRSYSDLYLPAFGLNADQNNSKYGRFHTVCITQIYCNSHKDKLF